MDRAEDAELAREQVDEIWRERRQEGSSRNIRDLQSSLDFLSKDLYEKQTHFLLELLQNADDNYYDDPNPCLTINYTGKGLSITCNERGFSRENVEAICRIGYSTKSGSERQKGYIGEKGIGFKSIFKVADAVWIASRKYSFMFDARERLGMITPVWSQFPHGRVEKGTSMYLELSAGCDKEAIHDEIAKFDPKMLIFLRRLKEIRLTVPYIGTRKISRVDETMSDGRISAVALFENEKNVSRYLIFHHTVHHMPLEEERPRITQSDILLAFPTTDCSDASEQPTHHVYAFLPLRDYGFTFLIQADFLLASNRKGIMSSPWNERIMSSIPQAFANSIERLNKTEMRYKWLRFLPHSIEHNDEFSGVRDAIFLKIKVMEILECENGHMARPNELRYVPPSFVLPGTPLRRDPQRLPRNLSPKYSQHDWDILRQLGVKEMGLADFLCDLQDLLMDSEFKIESQSYSWHTRLAEIFCEGFVLHDYINIIATLRIIPLRDKRWVSANEAQSMLFIPGETSNPHGIPEGIEQMEIDPESIKDDKRLDLFSRLGARPYAVNDIQKAVEQRHNFNSRPESFSVQALVSHAEFLFSTGWRNSNKVDLWVATQDGGYCRASKAYLTAPEANTSLFPTLHSAYRRLSPEGSETWIDWLKEELHVWNIPRMVDSLDADFKLSPEMSYLIDHWDSTKLLLLWRDNWPVYSEWLDTSISSRKPTKWRNSQAKLIRQLGSTPMACKGEENRRPLNQTFLPVGLSNLKSDINTDALPLLNVPDPQDQSWGFLKNLDVNATENIKYYLNFLIEMQQSGQSGGVFAIYKQIQSFAIENVKLVKQTFAERPLIYIPPSTQGQPFKWVATTDCVWDGPSFLTRVYVLKTWSMYNGCDQLFAGILGIKGTDLGTIGIEAERIEATDSLQYICDVFQCMDYLLTTVDSPKACEEIRYLSLRDIFPVTEVNNYSQKPKFRTCRSDDIWYIADRPQFSAAFEDKLPLLAFQASDLAGMARLFEALNIEQRLLSNAAVPIPRPGLAITPREDCKTFLLSKLEYITRLMSAQEPRRSEIIRLLRCISVHGVEEVDVQWVVRHPSSGSLTSRVVKSPALLVEQSRELHLYICNKHVDCGNMPLELAEQLSQQCTVPNEHIGLLCEILRLRNSEDIENSLAQRGFFQHFNSSNPNVQWAQAYGRTNRKQHSDQKKQSHKFFGLSSMEWWSQKHIKSQNSSESPGDSGQGANVPHNENETKAPMADSDQESKPSELSGRVNMVFLPSSDELSRLDSAGRNAKGVTILPACMQLRHTGERTIFIARNPSRSIEDQPAFLGEVFVSEFLQRLLGKAYNPGQHWKSPMQNRINDTTFESPVDRAMTSFTIDSASGFPITKFLIEHSYNKARGWSFPSYHIDVQTTEGSIDTPFPWNTHNFELARKCRIRDPPKRQDHVYIMIRIQNLYENPKALLFVDPWTMYRNGHLQVQFKSDLIASFYNDKKALTDLNVFKSRVEQRQSGGDSYYQMLTSILPRSFSYDIGSLPTGLYRWQPLREPANSIRILCLQPGKGGEDLVGELKTYRLADRPSYIALSYTWGTALQPFTLITSEGTVPLTTSLYLALRRMRKMDEDVYIWADAICINQSDNMEKAGQICLMPQIFRSATVVHAWIGEDREQSHEVLQTLRHISAHLVESESDSLPHGIHAGKGADQMPPLEDQFWDALAALLQRKWFRRVWVVQEVSLAKEITVFCGKQQIAWDELYEAVSLCFEYAQRSGGGFVLPQDSATAAILHLAQFRRKSHETGDFQPSHRLLPLLEKFQLTEATRTRDKLFAMRALAKDAPLGAAYTDYSAPIQSVVLQYASYFVRNQQAMELLYRAGPSSDNRFPSWVPNWTVAPFPKTLSTWVCLTTPGRFTAATKESECAHAVSDVLFVRGHLVDGIEYVGECPSGTTEFSSYLKETISLVKKVFQLVPCEGALECTRQLLVGDASTPSQGDWGPDNGETAFKALLKYLEQQDDTGPLDPIIEARKIEHATQLHNSWTLPDELRSCFAPYWATALEFASLFSTAVVCLTQASFGIVPATTRIGDRIALFHGSRVPFVVRESDIRKGYFNVVGECYIHQGMHGGYWGRCGDQDIKIRLV